MKRYQALSHGWFSATRCKMLCWNAVARCSRVRSRQLMQLIGCIADVFIRKIKGFITFTIDLRFETRHFDIHDAQVITTVPREDGTLYSVSSSPVRSATSFRCERPYHARIRYCHASFACHRVLLWNMFRTERIVSSKCAFLFVFCTSTVSAVFDDFSTYTESIDCF